MKLFSKQPKVCCPKCKTIHPLNSENKCPSCQAIYKLPERYEALKSVVVNDNKESKVNEIYEKVVRYGNTLCKKYASLTKSTKQLIRLSALMVLLLAIFIGILSLCFSDKEPLISKLPEDSCDAVIYHASDDTVSCLFTNGRTVSIGNGVIRQQLSSPDAKEVYLVFSGKPNLSDNREASNYVLRISGYKSLEVLDRNDDTVPEIAASADGKYLYVSHCTDESRGIYSLFLIEGGKEKKLISDTVKETCISPNGRHALVSVDDNGASKLLKYSVATGELTNPGIKNSSPISIDNKGEYLIYLKRTDTENAKIISEKSTDRRVEIPVISGSPLVGVIISPDRRSIGIEYSDRTTFHTCGTDYYITVMTYSGSTFSRKPYGEVCFNILKGEKIEIENISGQLLPYYFFDKERSGLYCVESDGAKIPVFNKTFDVLQVSSSGKVAFVSDGILYCGRLDYSSNDQTELMPFGGKTLFGMSPDGKKILYTDADGNLFSVNYGVKNDTPKKLASDPEFLRFSADGKTMLYSEDGSTIIAKGKKKINLGEGVIPTESYLADENLDTIIYTTERDGTKQLYIYKGGKSKLVCDSLKGLDVEVRNQIHITDSYFTDAER